MSRQKAPFRQADVTRAIKAALAAGLRVTGFRISVESGDIEVETADRSVSDSADRIEANEWDKL